MFSLTFSPRCKSSGTSNHDGRWQFLKVRGSRYICKDGYPCWLLDSSFVWPRVGWLCAAPVLIFLDWSGWVYPCWLFMYSCSRWWEFLAWVTRCDHLMSGGDVQNWRQKTSCNVVESRFLSCQSPIHRSVSTIKMWWIFRATKVRRSFTVWSRFSNQSV